MNTLVCCKVLKRILFATTRGSAHLKRILVKARHHANGHEAVSQRVTPSELAQLVNEQVVIARKQVNYHLTRAQAGATSRLPGVKTEFGPVVLGLVTLTETLRSGS